MSAPRFVAFADFWPYYVAQHLHPVNRGLHLAGTAVALCLLAAGLLSAGWLAGGALLAGYGPAWVGHFFFERNRPATFIHPLWSLLGDFKMFGLSLAGALGPHVEDARRRYPQGA